MNENLIEIDVEGKTNDKGLDAFLREYGYDLTDEQKAAVGSVEGKTMLLAVPGSGKTTVLVARLGYMVKVLGIPAGRILAVSYTKQGTEEMKDRYEAKFGRSDIHFKTINALSLEIYNYFCRRRNHEQRTLIINDQTKKIISAIVKHYEEKVVTIADSIRLQKDIGYCKNMMLTTDEEITEYVNDDGTFAKEFKKYKEVLDDPEGNNIRGVSGGKKLMDFDDQMVNALWILNNCPWALEYYASKYRYISIDEAQDTSKIQHEIIKALVRRTGNLFMVGDDDQSIYGFRAAYPEALLNFKETYPDSKCFYLTRNFRSDSNIVHFAGRFISKNSMRAGKKMVANKKSEEMLHIRKCKSRHAQYRIAVQKALQGKGTTAILYRDNESSALLAYYLMENGKEFNLRKPEISFFDFMQVKDIMAYIRLANDPYDIGAFKWLVWKGMTWPTIAEIRGIEMLMEGDGTNVFDAYMTINEDKGRKFSEMMDEIRGVSTSEAIDILLENGYREYLKDNEMSLYRVETLRFLAEEIPDQRRFIEKMDALKEVLGRVNIAEDPNAITLSTVHTAKGREWDSVHFIDLSSDVWGSDSESTRQFLREEARRLFYVGMTRAKKSLTLYVYEGDAKFPFVDELICYCNESKA